MLQLSPNFSLAELTRTDTGLENNPNPAQVGLLRNLAAALEKVRARALDNKPMTIDSAYRSPAVNAAVGGVANSAHLLCYAADFRADEFGPPLEVAEAIAACGRLPATDSRKIVFDQLIYEQHEDGPAGDWVHFSRDPQARMQTLTRLPDGAYVGGLVGRK